MAYNALSGTIVINETIAFEENGGERGSMTRNKVMGQFYGDGQYLW